MRIYTGISLVRIQMKVIFHLPFPCNQNQYIHHKELRAAQGIKIEAKELEKCIAGLNLLIAHHPDEIDICTEEIEERLSTVMNSFKTKDRGVFVQASTLGSLEALLEFLRTSKIPVSYRFSGVVQREPSKSFLQVGFYTFPQNYLCFL